VTEENQPWVEVDVKETPPPESPEPPKEEVPEPKPAPEYGSRAEKRIRQLVARAKELEDRATRAEALAAQREAESRRVAEQAKGTENSAISVYAQSLDTKLKTAEKRFQDAYEAADKEALLQAQHELIEAKLELKALDSWNKSQNSRTQAPAPAPAQVQAPQAPPQLNVAPATQEWMAKNPWFGRGEGKDPIATMAAVGVSEQLIAEGYDPSSAEFYEEVDRRIVENIPRLRAQEPRNPVVAGSRTPTRRIRLDEATVATSKKLGVALEDAARYAEKIQAAGNDYVTIDVKRRR
jgi:hypothetical protein